MRHEGFIPWDDDIDLCMPLEDYNTLLELGETSFGKDIFFQTMQSDTAFKFDYIKLRSNKAKIVEFHEEDQEIAYHQGVFVDIFPMLSIEDTPENFKDYHETFEKIRATSAISLHTPDGQDNPKQRTALIKQLDSKHQGWEKNDLKVIYSGKMPDIAVWFDYAALFPLKKMDFEGFSFAVPKDTDHYLSALYAFDYRELPPEDKRTVHALGIEVYDSVSPT